MSGTVPSRDASTLAPPTLPERELRAARDGYHAALRDAAPRLSEATAAWLETILPPRWALEWSLPYWLGECFDLPTETTRRLISSNVVGLAYIRLQDALADGEAFPFQPSLAPLLSTLLHQRWLHEYRALFGEDPQFWARFEQCMAEWLEAAVASDETPARAFRDYTSDDFLHLAHRGAPLKVCCVGACLLAGREDMLPTLTDAVDHLLVGAVLLDHAQDWSDDLADGRYNALVAYASPHPQTPAYLQMNTRQVQREICLGDAARPYFQIALEHLRIACELAESVDCPDLQRYLVWLTEQAAAYRARLADSAAALLNDAVRYLFGPMISTDSEQRDSRKEGFSND